jgi:hypothetical protein
MFHRLDASAHRGAHRQANVPRQFGNQLLLGGVTTLSSQYNTTHENHIALFGPFLRYLLQELLNEI